MRRRGVLALCMAAVVAGGAGTAIAAGGIGSSSTKPADDPWVQALAKRLGTTPDKLADALKGAALDRADQLLADGTLTQAQVDALKQRIEQNGGLGLRGFGPGGLGFRGHLGLPGGVRLGGELNVAATYLGMSEAALRTALQGGKSLADVAKDQNKTTDGLKAALLADATTKVNALTRLTAAEKKALLDRISQQLDALIARSGGPLLGRGGPGLGDRDGPGGHGGFGGRGWGPTGAGGGV